jgi:hypothetical protein
MIQLPFPRVPAERINELPGGASFQSEICHGKHQLAPARTSGVGAAFDPAFLDCGTGADQ